MKCDDANELFSDYVSGNMEAALTVSLENHLASCAQCRETVATLRQVWETLDHMPAVEPPPFFHENMMSRIAAETTRAEATRRNLVWDWRALFRPRTLAYAAALVVLLFLGMEGLHATRASLDPLGSMLHMLQPAPAPVMELHTAHAEWSPNIEGGGVLTVHLQAQPGQDGQSSTLACTINLPGGVLAPNVKTEAAVSSDKETILYIPTTGKPNVGNITVTLSSEGHKATVPLTLMVPLNDPEGKR